MLYIIYYILILFEGVCGSKRTVLMTRARITRFGPRLHVPIWLTGPTCPTSARCACCRAICSRFGDQLNRILYREFEQVKLQAQQIRYTTSTDSHRGRSMSVKKADFANYFC